jgi:hypothetical protein
MATTTRPPTRGRARRRSRDAQILANIDFNRKGAGTEEIAEYSATGRDICRDLAQEVSITAALLEKKLGSIKGGGLRDRWAARRLARKVVRPLKQMADLLNGAGDYSMRFWKEYATAYADLIDPDRRDREWKFTEGRDRS